jgi:hypothetical protein
MEMGLPKPELHLCQAEESSLITRSRSIFHAAHATSARRAGSRSDESNSAVARRFELTQTTVGKWRARLLRRRIAGLCDKLRLTMRANKITPAGQDPKLRTLH